MVKFLDSNIQINIYITNFFWLFLRKLGGGRDEKGERA